MFSFLPDIGVFKSAKLAAASQAIASTSTGSFLAATVVLWDQGSFQDSSHAGALVCRQAGVCWLVANVSIASIGWASPGFVDISIYKNGTRPIASRTVHPVINPFFFQLNLETLDYASPGDFYQVFMSCQATVALTQEAITTASTSQHSLGFTFSIFQF